MSSQNIVRNSRSQVGHSGWSPTLFADSQSYLGSEMSIRCKVGAMVMFHGPSMGHHQSSRYWVNGQDSSCQLSHWKHVKRWRDGHTLASHAGQRPKMKKINSLSLKFVRALYDRIIGAAVVIPRSSVGQSISLKALSSSSSHSVVCCGVGFYRPVLYGPI